MDLTDTIVPRSDQLNAEDLLSGPRTVTITEVRKGASAEQPVDIVLAEFGDRRPFKPSKTVRRILVAAWGPDAATYTGRRMTIYRDPAVKFGGQDVGGIRVSHLSHIDKPLTVALTVTRGKRAPHKVQPLAEPSGLDEFKPETTTNPAGNVQPRTEEQSAQLFELLKANDLADKDAALAFINAELGRTETDALTSTKHLTRAEADRVIDALNRLGK